MPIVDLELDLVSLLGTWQGQTVEVWNANTSNILQVITGIQGLILGVSEPFYNEPGFVRPAGPAVAQSLRYSERAFCDSLDILCQVQTPISSWNSVFVFSRFQMVENPPDEFRDLIRAHFREYAEETRSLLKFLIDSKPKTLSNPPETFRLLMEKYCIHLSPARGPNFDSSSASEASHIRIEPAQVMSNGTHSFPALLHALPPLLHRIEALIQLFGKPPGPIKLF